MHPVFENRKHAFIDLQEGSLHILVSFRAQAVHPAQVGWLTNLHSLMEKYFRYIPFFKMTTLYDIRRHGKNVIRDGGKATRSSKIQNK